MKTSDAQYVGIPYGYMGIPPKAADCWTLVRYFAQRELGQLWPRYMYAMATQSADSVALITEHSTRPEWLHITDRPCDMQLAKRGDVLILTVAGLTQHCGVYLGAGQLLHSLGTGRNSTIESVDRWAHHIEAVLRWNKGAA